MKYNFVYITTCSVNKKMYIGKHSTDDLNDGYLGSGMNFTIALEKYGEDKFSRRIVGYFATSNSAYRAEHMLLKLINAADNPMYYNLFDENHRTPARDCMVVPTSSSYKGELMSEEVKCWIKRSGNMEKMRLIPNGNTVNILNTKGVLKQGNVSYSSLLGVIGKSRRKFLRETYNLNNRFKFNVNSFKKMLEDFHK